MNYNRLKGWSGYDPDRCYDHRKSATETLDHGSPLPNLGSKMGIDATQKGKDEGFNRDWPEALKMDAGVKIRIDKIWKEMEL